MAMALDAADLDEAAERVRKLVDFAPPGASLSEKIGALIRLAPLANASRKSCAMRSVHEVVIDEPDLTQLPVLTTWPLDGGPFITLPLVITKDPRSGPSQRRNVPHAGVQRARNRDALAAPQARTRARGRCGAPRSPSRSRSAAIRS